MSRSDNPQQLGSRSIRPSPFLLLAAALVALAVFFVNYAPPAAADHDNKDVWSATLTVGNAAPDLGFDSSIPVGTLSNRNFRYAGVDNGFDWVLDRADGRLFLKFFSSPSILKSSGLTLHVGNRQFALADSTVVDTDLHWNNANLNWSAGDTIELKLTGPYWTGVDLYGGGLVLHSDGALTLDVTKSSGNTFKVRLTQAPTATVTITFSKLATVFGIDDFDAFDAAPETVTFTTSNWQTGKTASVVASEDAAVGDSIIISAAVSIAAGANANDPYRSPEQRNGFVVTVKAGGL